MSNWREIIRNHISESQQTIPQVADMVGITEGGLRHWLNGTRTPSIDQFISLCVTLRLDPCVALSGHFKQVEHIKTCSPVVSKTFQATPDKSEAHKKLMTKLRAFKQASRRAKSHR